MSLLKPTFDIIISGAGPIGSIAALALSRSPFIHKILLVQKSKPNLSLSTIPNQRVYSINPSSSRIMQSLGIFPSLSRRGTINRIKVFKDQDSVCFEQKEMSHVIENDSILKEAHEQISDQSSIQTMFDDQIQTVEFGRSKVDVVMKSGTKASSKLLIASDGNKSKVRQLSDIRSYGWKYNQTAIVCTLQLDKPIDTAFQRYYDNNVLAVLPLWDNFASIVWSVENPFYLYLKDLTEEEFKEELVNASCEFDFKIQGVLNKRLTFPLNTIQSQRYIGHRVALIGDAAHSIHPMAGLGVNSGFADAAHLVNNIIRNLKAGNDIGEQIALKGFENEAKKLNYSNSVTMEAIKKGFEWDGSVFGFLRRQTMKTLDKSEMIKSALIESAKSNPFFPKAFEWEV